MLQVECLFHQTIKGLKWMTRRSGGLEWVNGRKATKTQPAIEANPDEWALEQFRYMTTKQVANDVITGMHTHTVTFKNKINGNQKTCTARYKVGEVLYLKEPTAKAKIIDGKQIYAYLYGCNGNKEMISEFKWENKLFMPADRARAFIRITGIKCESLLDISEADCIAEGIETVPLLGCPGMYNGKMYDGYVKGYIGKPVYSTPKMSFLSLYRFANKVKEVPNLWVWCYSYEYLPNYKP